MAFFKAKRGLAFAANALLGGNLLKLIAPIPDIEKSNRILFVGPHPDDVEIGAGATLNKFVKSGKVVKMVVCTDGGAGSMDATKKIEDIVKMRLEESERAANLLGAQEFVNLNFPDGGRYSEDDLAEKLAQEIYSFKPDLVLCPDPYLPTETHPDHVKCGRATGSASAIASNYFSAKRHNLDFDPKQIVMTRKLAYYFTHRPNVFVEVSEKDTSARLNAIKCHKSQFSSALAEGLALYLALRDKEMAAFVNDDKRKRIKWAEGFFAMAPLHQHVTSETNYW